MPLRKKSELKDFELFIFDWDGTLNSLRITMRLNEALKRALGLWNKDSSIKDFKHVDYDLKKRLKREERSNDAKTFLFEFFLSFSKPKLHNDTMQIIKKLRKKGKRIAIFSNGRSKRLIRELAYLGIADYFDMIISARDLNALKPNPTGIKAILHSLHVSPQKAVYIGDMVDDAITAKLANVPSCAIASGFDSYHALRSINPDYLFKSMEELNSFL